MKRRIGSIPSLFITAALLLPPSIAEAGDTRYVWTSPLFQSKPDSCSETDTIPETSLSHALMTLSRIDTTDTIDLGQKPLSGPGLEDSVDVSTVDSVWAHVFTLRNVDAAGNVSCGFASYLRVIPVTEWPPAAPPANPGLSARYFENQDFSGPTADVVDPAVDFDCAAGWDTQGLGPGWFSARWVGLVSIPEDGVWDFCVDSDDGARLWVDDRLLVDRWSGGRLKACGSSGFSSGTFSIRLDFFQNGGACLARLSWTPPGGSEAVVPASALSR